MPLPKAAKTYKKMLKNYTYHAGMYSCMPKKVKKTQNDQKNVLYLDYIRKRWYICAACTCILCVVKEFLSVWGFGYCLFLVISSQASV